MGPVVDVGPPLTAAPLPEEPAWWFDGWWGVVVYGLVALVVFAAAVAGLTWLSQGTEDCATCFNGGGDLFSVVVYALLLAGLAVVGVGTLLTRFHHWHRRFRAAHAGRSRRGPSNL